MQKLLLLLILLQIIFIGCAPEQPPRILGSNVDENSTSSDPFGMKDPSSAGFTTIQWYSQNAFSNTVTIDADNKQNIYLRGDDVYNFLLDPASFSAQYCLIVDFVQTSSTTPRQLRVLAVPQKVINYATGEAMLFFRTNLNTDSGNSHCNKNIEAMVAGGSTQLIPPPALIANHPSQVCSTCQNLTSSENKKVQLYQLHTGLNVLTAVPQSKLNLSPLVFRINVNNNTNNNTITCTNAQCQSLGFNCCFEGQCVNDGQIKSNVNQTTDQGFLQAELEKLANPNWYKNYPQYYYSCLELVPSNPNPGNDGPTDPNGDAVARLNALIADYECIKELSDNTESVPFQKNINTSYSPKLKCSMNTSDQMYYQTVLKRLYSNCGCSRTDFNEMLEHCPAYTYKPVYVIDRFGNNTSTIQDIVCQAPQPDSDKLPFQNMSVTVNSRSAPHRFFNTDNQDLSYWVTNGKQLPSSISSTTQEGETFMYLDQDKIMPLNGTFNMNSILGQMSTTLNKTYPAKVVELEFDKMYYIATLSGHYTPCPNCSKDSWFQNFSAHPTSTQGVGVQQVGYSTSRDSWANNISYGNYEDTIFGRACWIPPTMIPWSHNEHADAQTQRLNRLKTQAALYANGYQRDWYGFNKGALIGSFDGVTWFAVGKGRIVKSTSTKLFLAINAAFADLAEPTEHIVSVQEYDFMTTATRYDYDPNYNLNNTFQNEAGTCQASHMCNTDRDCITRLGWEYVCTNPYALKTKWPVFDPLTVEEQGGQSRTSNLINFLQQAELVSDATFEGRCVYRGAGAPCRIDYDSISDEGLRRSMTCAPNFYCASVNANGVFNREVARFGAPLENLLESDNHFFGKEANVLGRPLNYLAINSNSHSLDADIRNTLSSNLSVQDPGIGNMAGICLPGRQTPTLVSTSSATTENTTNHDPRTTHARADSDYRTDYISQIGGCNSGLYTRFKHAACPALDEDGNYIHLETSFKNKTDAEFMSDFAEFMSDLNRYTASQNSCGMEALATGDVLDSMLSIDPDNLRESSPFKFLEGRTLASGDVQVEPTFARDACFRKAGAVCHTDYDCYPNRKHAELIDVYGMNFFGNEAEMNYHKEYLVCGQAQPTPTIAEIAAGAQYNLSNNRCCRPIGETLTMYTATQLVQGVNNGDFRTSLKPDTFGSFFPSNPDRYSRYSVLPYKIDLDRRPNKNDNTYSQKAYPLPSARSTGDFTIKDKRQWKTIAATAQRTCCGGGWVRKFADGTNNWSINRLDFDVNNFQCLNYKTPLVATSDATPFGEQNLNIVRNDLINYCRDNTGATANCALLEFDNSSDVGVIKKPKPNVYNKESEIHSAPVKMADQWAKQPWSFSIPIEAEGGHGISWLNWDLPESDPTFRRNVMVTLPTWVTFKAGRSSTPDPAGMTGWNEYFREISDGNLGNMSVDDGVEVYLELPNGPYFQCSLASDDTDYPDYPWTIRTADDFFDNDTCDAANGCCYKFDPSSRILRVSFTPLAGANYDPSENSCNFGADDTCPNANGRALSMMLRFRAAGTAHWENFYVDNDKNIVDSTPQVVEHRRSVDPGNIYYYLERLGRFELVGIPQMTYAPLYCSDNYQKLVPGLFKEEFKTIGQFTRLTSDSSTHPAGITAANPYAILDAENCMKVSGSNATSTDCSPYDFHDETVMDANQRANVSPITRSVVVTEGAVAIEPIWSAEEFKCCLGVNEQTTSADLCCSGHAVSVQSSGGNSSDAPMYCKLPKGTNLNVYFNRFITSEGTDEEVLGSDALNEGRAGTTEYGDFNPTTGEPLMTAEVLQKLAKLGTLYCENGTTRRGSVFGQWNVNFNGQVEGTSGGLTMYGFLDSLYDREVSGGSTPRDAADFYSGYRWNHQVYCD